MSRMVYFDHLGNEIDAPKSDVIKTNATNADRIRSMTDEELCNEFFNILEKNLWRHKNPKEKLLEWLKQESI